MQSMADPTIYSIKGWGEYDTVSDVVYMYVQFASKKVQRKKLFRSGWRMQSMADPTIYSIKGWGVCRSGTISVIASACR